MDMFLIGGYQVKTCQYLIQIFIKRIIKLSMRRTSVQMKGSKGIGVGHANTSDNATVCSFDCQLQIDYVLDNYRGASKYCLNHINSILIKDGKIYNLLERMSPKRRIKCGCVKSNCEAKYCQCYRAGETCGEGCSCTGCKNRKYRKNGSNAMKEEEFGCNCVKSGCLKKYCECYQNGKKCSSRCGCCDCKNWHFTE